MVFPLILVKSDGCKVNSRFPITSRLELGPPKQIFAYLAITPPCARCYLFPPEPPATETTPPQLPDDALEKTPKEKRKRKKDRERDRSKAENKEEQGTTQGKPDEEKPRKTPFPTQPVTGNPCSSVLEKHEHKSEMLLF